MIDHLKQAQRFRLTYLGRERECTLEAAELRLRAEEAAAALSRRTQPGDRALLLFAPGPEFVVAFFACLWSGVVAVPVPAPVPARRTQTESILERLMRDCRPALTVTTADLKVSDDDLVIDLQQPPAGQSCLPRLFPELAYLQYSSGSTASPRAVKISHANLLANSRAIVDTGEFDRHSSVLCWVPHFHDMGLVSGTIVPLLADVPIYQMSPLEVVQRPLRWLRAVSQYRVSHSPAPNFAFDMCVDRIAPEQRVELDLSCWKMAYNGAEPVRSGTVERFLKAFEPCGFAPDSMRPCYGLAEATLMVSGARREAPRMLTLDAEALARNELELSQGGVTVVSCGEPAPHTQISIRDIATGEAATVGEVVVSGPGVAGGYWGDPSNHILEAGTVRTGDVGFLHEGQLYITGRVKDLIICAGRNFYPNDIEQVAESVAPILGHNRCVAFGAPNGSSGEKVILMAEQGPEQLGAELHHTVSRALSRRLGLVLNELVIVPRGAIPRTTSGKPRRASCRQLYQQGRELVRLR